MLQCHVYGSLDFTHLAIQTKQNYNLATGITVTCPPIFPYSMTPGQFQKISILLMEGHCMFWGGGQSQTPKLLSKLEFQEGWGRSFKPEKCPWVSALQKIWSRQRTCLSRPQWSFSEPPEQKKPDLSFGFLSDVHEAFCEGELINIFINLSWSIFWYKNHHFSRN